MSLREYKKKRNFRKTPEPADNVAATGKRTTKSGHHFVIQKHDASRLHYDFRLELDGTLKSWAVPKGPCLDPKVKSLAVHVEDHPLSYAGFEGIIPEGEYGGGTVMVWDRGDWRPEGDAAKDYRAGKLKFELDGEKLHGSWALVRMRGRAGEDGKNWLLIKHDDEAARPIATYDVLKQEPLSVLSQRDLLEIAEDADRTWHSNGVNAAKSVTKAKPKLARRAASAKSASKSIANAAGARKATQPTKLQPQLATLAQEAPTGEGWLHELKFDGYRIVAFLENGHVRLISRNGKEWTKRFPKIAAALAKLPVKQAILDGEIVALNDEGISDFQRLQNALSAHDDAELVYYVFDLPHCEGYNLTATPLLKRKELLQTHTLAALKSNDGLIRYSDHVVGQGEDVLRQACRKNMEGIVCKRADAPYEHARSRSWLKVKCTQRQEFVICGYSKPTGARVGLGALLLGYYQNGELVYAGRVGTGFTDESLRSLTTKLRGLRTKDSPFKKPLTTSQRRGVTWVEPTLVGEVEFTEWTDDGLLRHPSFQGLREDKPASKITREKAVTMKGRDKTTHATPTSRQAKGVTRLTQATKASSIVAGVTITHPERVLYPENGLTKLGLARYYESVADWILPHVADRPLTLVRCPGGRDKQCFYQKHIAGTLPPGIREIPIKEKTGMDQYLAIDSLPGLIALVQMGVLEFHPWPARADKVEAPDRLIFDLDPGEGVTLDEVIVATRELHDRLAEIGLETFLRTSGGKGFHVVAPLSRRNSWDELKEFAKAVADVMVRRAPDRYIATLSKAKRRGKIFVDYLRNQRGSTAVASYSTRARENAPVAAPLAWRELTARTKPDQFTVANIGKRLAKLAADPWADFFSARQSLTKAMFAALD
jgi:bifunctional non-homologous end joining protein LigD